jgi:hypothetical protein
MQSWGFGPQASGIGSIASLRWAEFVGRVCLLRRALRENGAGRGRRGNPSAARATVHGATLLTQPRRDGGDGEGDLVPAR